MPKSEKKSFATRIAEEEEKLRRAVNKEEELRKALFGEVDALVEASQTINYESATGAIEKSIQETAQIVEQEEALRKTAFSGLGLNYVNEAPKQKSKNKLQKNIPEPVVQVIQEGGRMNFAIYQKLRAYCMQDLGQYINGIENNAVREMRATFAGNKLLGYIEHEKQRALSLFHSIDLTPKELAASHLLAVISNYRMITWHRESSPPHGFKQLPPLKKTEDDKLVSQTSQAISEYVCYLPEREAAALLSVWQSSLALKPTPDTAKLEPDKSQKCVSDNQEIKGGASAPLKLGPNIFCNKLKRNILDPAIDKAIKETGTTDTQDVYLHLKELAKDEFPPFTGAFDGDAMCYTNENNKPDAISKAALRKRLMRRQKPLTDVKGR
jgi:hypothetical protein